MSELPWLKARLFIPCEGANAKRVSLLQYSYDGYKPVKGWKFVGVGEAPWPGSAEGQAVMLEKIIPAGTSSIDGPREVDGCEYPEGTRIWQHCYYDELIIT